MARGGGEFTSGEKLEGGRVVVGALRGWRQEKRRLSGEDDKDEGTLYYFRYRVLI